MAPLTSSGQLVSYSGIVCLILAYVFVGLRLLVRVLRRQALFDHDYMVLASTVVFTAYCAVQWNAVYNPLGTIDFTVLPSAPLVFIPVVTKSFVLEILIGFCITFAKLSLLLLWRRIFVGDFFKKANYVVMGIACAWLVSWTIALSLRCTPVRAAWDALAIAAGAQCRDLAPDLTAYEATNIFVDILILALPLNEVRKLQIATRKKVAVGFSFVVGGFVIVTSAVKIYYCNEPATRLGAGATAVDVPQVFTWSTYEQCSSIICACLPTLYPLLRPGARTSSSKPSYSAKPSTGRSKLFPSSSGRRSQYHDLELSANHGNDALLRTSTTEPETKPPGAIHVRRDFDVSRS